MCECAWTLVRQAGPEAAWHMLYDQAWGYAVMGHCGLLREEGLEMFEKEDC